MADHYLTQGASAANLVRTLTDRDGPINLTGATTTFCMSRYGTNVVNDGACSVVGVATAGTVSYPFTTTNTANAGVFEGQFKVTFGSGAIQFFPSNRKLSIEILPTDDA